MGQLVSFNSELFRRILDSSGSLEATEILAERYRLRLDEHRVDLQGSLKGLREGIDAELKQHLPGNPSLELRLTGTDSNRCCMRWFLTIASGVRFHYRQDDTDPVYSHYKRHFWYCRSQNGGARQTRMLSSPSKNPSCTCRPEYTRKSSTASETHRTSWFAPRTRLAWRRCARRSISAS